MGDKSRADVAPTAGNGVRLGHGGLGDDEALIELWARGREQSRRRHEDARSERRRRRRHLGASSLVAAGLLALAGALVAQGLDLDPPGEKLGFAGDGEIVLTAVGPERTVRDRPAPDPGGSRQRAPRRPPIVPAPGALKEASSYAQARGGSVSIAVVDTRGRLRGQGEHRRYSSASVVKSMLLAAELRRLEREGLPLDAETESLLRAMITYSDNDAADTIYYRVGDAGLFEVARLAEMNGFTVAGHWGNAQITAADMALMFSESKRVYGGRHREFGLGLLGSIVSEQSWGIPAVARPRWAVRFKGGWVTTERGQLAHQAAELRDGSRHIAMAVLTDYQPSMTYAMETVRGIAERLLSQSADRGRSVARARGPRGRPEQRPPDPGGQRGA
jgi:Beta-lactamase enzyme family